MRKHLKPLKCPRNCGYRDGDQGRINKHLGRIVPCVERSVYSSLAVFERDQRLADMIRRHGKTWELTYQRLFNCAESEVPSPCKYTFKRKRCVNLNGL